MEWDFSSFQELNGKLPFESKIGLLVLILDAGTGAGCTRLGQAMVAPSLAPYRGAALC